MDMKKPPTHEDFTREWGERVAAGMAVKGLTDADMAKAVTEVLQLPKPLFPSSFHNYRSQIRQPQPATQWAIAQVLEVPARELFPLDLKKVAA